MVSVREGGRFFMHVRVVVVVVVLADRAEEDGPDGVVMLNYLYDDNIVSTREV